MAMQDEKKVDMGRYRKMYKSNLDKRRQLYIKFLVIAGCLIMAWVDAVLSPNYAIKSAVKFVFLLLPLGYSLIDRQISFRNLFAFNKKTSLFSLFLGIGVYVLILGAYFIVGNYFDFSKVTMALENNIGVNKNNFVFVALYISFINSLLEEFFFRGFAFLALKKISHRKVACFFSASVFSLYHIAIMKSWFTPPLFILLILSLFISGIFFNWLNEKNDNIFASWMVHMFANFAINTIGFILFDII